MSSRTCRTIKQIAHLVSYTPYIRSRKFPLGRRGLAPSDPSCQATADCQLMLSASTLLIMLSNVYQSSTVTFKICKYISDNKTMKIVTKVF